MRTRVFGHMRTAKAPIRLRANARAVRSRHSLSANRRIGYCKMHMNGEQRPGWYIAHAQNDLKLLNLRIFEGPLSFDAAHIVKPSRGGGGNWDESEIIRKFTICLGQTRTPFAVKGKELTEFHSLDPRECGGRPWAKHMKSRAQIPKVGQVKSKCNEFGWVWFGRNLKVAKGEKRNPLESFKL